MKRLIIILATIAVLAGLITIGIFDALANGNTTGLEELVYAEYPMQRINYSYTSSGVSQATTEYATIYYSHALLTQPSTQLNGELAKVSVALAMAAYKEYHIDDLLGKMGFDVYDNSSVYYRSSEQLTYEDNDYVAYTIGQREWINPETGEVYVFYCVPIKGTTKNAEWFSNFNLGKDIEHEGFRKASLEVYNKLQSYFEADNAKDKNHRFVLLTGHSRGAACANLISGWLSADDAVYTSMEHVFGYTFACPAVSMNADATLTNIYNFNNPGDMITMLPMEDWGYDRYGQDMKLDTKTVQLRNFEQRFVTVTGDTYAASLSGAEYLTILRNLIGSDVNVYHDTASLQLLLDFAAWGLGGSNDVPNIGDVVAAHLLNEEDGKINKNQVEKILVEASIGVKTLVEVMYNLQEETANSDILAGQAYRAYEETLNMTEEEFADYLLHNSYTVRELEEETDKIIRVPNDFLVIYGILNTSKYDLLEVREIIQAAKDLFFDDDGNVLTKIGHGHAQATYVTWINSMYYGYYGWYNNTSVMEVVIEESISSIGDECFSGCSSLTNLVIPDSVTILGGYSVANCDGLKSITLPVDYVEGNGTFTNTNNVNTIYYTPGRTGVMPDDRQDCYDNDWNYEYTNYDTLEYNNRESVVSVEFAKGITHIGDVAFDSCTKITKVVLPEGLISIGDFAFSTCIGLTEIELPESLTSIGVSAFGVCISLKEIDLPEGLTSICDYTFFGCDSLTEIQIPDSVTSIGDSAFWDCIGLAKIELPESLTSIGMCAFDTCISLKEIDLPEGLTSICNSTFWGCASLTEIQIPDSVTSIGDAAFRDCIGLAKIELPENLTSIGSDAFGGCIGLTEIELPENLISIGDYAFRGCIGLTEITFPNSLRYMGKGVVDGCTSIKKATLPIDCEEFSNLWIANVNIESIHFTYGQTGVMCDFNGAKNYSEPLKFVDFEEGITHIGKSAFYNFDRLTEVVLPESLTSIGDSAFYNCKGLTEIVFPECLTSIGDSAFAWCEGLTEVVLPESLTSIGEDVFYNCKGLTEIVFPEGLTSIGKYAFGYCDGLTEVVLPESLTSIGDSAFYNCNGLTEIVFPEGLTSIGKYAFGYCDGLTEVVLPKNLDSIGYCTFIECENLTEVVLPENLTSIGDYAFNYCTGLTEIIFEGNAPSFGASCFRKVTATAYYPEGNSTWTDEVMQDYGGSITWVEMEPGHGGLMGDMDNDGALTAYDALMIKKYCVGMISFEAEYAPYADLNADGTINAKDLLLLSKLLAV